MLHWDKKYVLNNTSSGTLPHCQTYQTHKRSADLKRSLQWGTTVLNYAFNIIIIELFEESMAFSKLCVL